jgi:hypothetical protein
MAISFSTIVVKNIISSIGCGRSGTSLVDSASALSVMNAIIDKIVVSSWWGQ